MATIIQEENSAALIKLMILLVGFSISNAVHGVVLENAHENTDLVFPCNNTFLRSITSAICACVDGHGIICNPFAGHLDSILTNMSRFGYNATPKLHLTALFNYKLAAQPLDIRTLKNFTKLKELSIVVDFVDVPVPIKFLYDDLTSRSFYRLDKLQINVPLDTGIADIIGNLIFLKSLDLSYTKYLGDVLKYEFQRGFLSRRLNDLKLRNFQDCTSKYYMRSLYFRDFLAGRHPYLTRLDLAYNCITHVWGGLFYNLPSIIYLDLSNNMLVQSKNTPFIMEALMHPTIEVLDIGNQQIREEHSRTNNYQTYSTKFDTFHADSLVSINRQADDSGLPMNVETSNFETSQMPLHTISCIDTVTKGNISALFGNSSLNVVCNVTRTCFRSSWEFLRCDNVPDLYELLDFNCLYWVKFPIGKNIKELALGNFDLDPTTETPSLLEHKNICFRENKLEKLDLSGNYRWANLNIILAGLLAGKTKLSGLENLEHVSLRNNRLKVHLQPIKVNLPSLKTLDLSLNTELWSSYDLSLCKDMGLRNIEHADFGSVQNKLEPGTITMHLISHCNKLRTLNMTKSSLDSKFSIFLGDAQSLELLDLSMNNLTLLNEQFVQQLDRAKAGKDLKIDLSGNPMSCSCDKQSLHSVKWIEENKYSFVHFTDLKCQSSEGILHLSMLPYGSLRNKCVHMDIIVSIISTLAVVVLVIIAVVTYRTRFRLQYKCLKIQRLILGKFRCRNTEEDEGDTDSYEYDAFVSYSSMDRFWVHDVLMKTLEETYGFKLVIHYRDFLLGQNVQRAIDNSIRNSRAFILVLSENFLESEWCQTEMEEAYRESLRRRSGIAIVVLGEVPCNIHHPTARLLLDNYNYLQWRVSEDGEHQDTNRQKLFWSKLVHHLYGNKQACLCCLPIGPRSLGYRDVQRFTQSNPSCITEENNDDSNSELSMDTSVDDTEVSVMGNDGRVFETFDLESPRSNSA